MQVPFLFFQLMLQVTCSSFYTRRVGWSRSSWILRPPVWSQDRCQICKTILVNGYSPKGMRKAYILIRNGGIIHISSFHLISYHLIRTFYEKKQEWWDLVIFLFHSFSFKSFEHFTEKQVDFNLSVVIKESADLQRSVIFLWKMSRLFRLLWRFIDYNLILWILWTAGNRVSFGCFAGFWNV